MLSQHPNIRISQHCSSDPKDVFDKLGVIADKPKFTQYASYERRLESFKTWPEDLNQKPSILAEAGFAFTGVSDAVRCYHCGNGLRNWEPNDCPWNQHALHFRQCAHVRQCKGEDYIRQVHGELSVEMDCACDNGNNAGEEVNRLNCLRQANSVAVQAAMEFDILDNQIEGALKYFLSRGIETFSGRDLIKTVEEIENGELCIEQTDTSDTKSETKAKESHNDESKHYSDMKEENDSIKDQFTCKICYESRACIITIPCGHMVTCPQCIGPLKTCCICRSPIQGTVRAFLSDGQ